jgi:hypothetical protein
MKWVGHKQSIKACLVMLSEYCEDRLLLSYYSGLSIVPRIRRGKWSYTSEKMDRFNTDYYRYAGGCR